MIAHCGINCDESETLMSEEQGSVCPAELAGSLDNRLRRLLQNPRKILRPYVQEGMTALDVGCGPGFFTLPMAQLVGSSGRVIAADLQEEMLDKVRAKIAGTDLEKRIAFQKCEPDSIGVAEKVDFVLLFYMVHELPDKDGFFRQIAGVLKPAGQVLLVEPPFHVSKPAFDITLQKANAAGLASLPGPRMPFDKTATLRLG
jgi:ubiquinone/menaquinone biosynthesis C-methylase UbiE